MKKALLSLCLAAAAAFGQYKVESAGAPPADLAPEIRDALQKNGTKITGPAGVFAELWLRESAPAGGSNSEMSVTFTDLAHGTLLGVLRFPSQGADRRGQTIKPGVYTMRLSFYPVDGAHQGVAPQRDFALLVPASIDKDPAATPNYKEVVEMSKKAAGSPHPAVFEIWKDEGGQPGTIEQSGDDWVFHGKMGGKPIAIIVAGTHHG